MFDIDADVLPTTATLRDIAATDFQTNDNLFNQGSGYVDLNQPISAAFGLVDAQSASTPVLSTTLRLQPNDKIKPQINRQSGNRTSAQFLDCKLEMTGTP